MSNHTIAGKKYKGSDLSPYFHKMLQDFIDFFRVHYDCNDIHLEVAF
ncbi:hypothetical protein ES705_19598 [subsurface metagenome]